MMAGVHVIRGRPGPAWSTRLPGKVLRDLGGAPVLSWVVRAAQAATLVDEVVVATTTLPEDDATAELAARAGAVVVRVRSTTCLPDSCWPSTRARPTPSCG